MTLLNMNIVIDNVVKFCYEIQLLWNALNPLKCKCGYNYRANMTLSNLIGCNACCSWDEWLIDSLPVPRGTRGAVAASLLMRPSDSRTYYSDHSEAGRYSREVSLYHWQALSLLSLLCFQFLLSLAWITLCQLFSFPAVKSKQQRTLLDWVIMYLSAT